MRRTKGNLESQFAEAIVTGNLVDLRTRNPAQGARWSASCTVKGSYLSALLKSRSSLHSDQATALRIRGARVVGPLDLEGVALPCPLLMQDCCFEGSVNLTDATAPVIRMPGCHVPGLLADQLETSGNLELNEGFFSAGEIRLRGAHVGGYLNFRGATLDNAKGRALSAELITVGQNLYCLDSFIAKGQVSLRGARIHGQVHFGGANLTGYDEVALLADVITVDQSFLCGTGDPFIVHGALQLSGARIGGVLDLTNASLSNPSGSTLYAPGLSAEFGIWCRRNFVSQGKIDLNGARTGGVLEMDGARLCNPPGVALFADGFKAEFGMHCKKLIAHGEIHVATSHIGGELDLSTAELSCPDGVALNLQAAEVSALLLPENRPEGTVDLTNAKVGALTDNPTSWPEKLQMRGFIYDTLERGDRDQRRRLKLLGDLPSGYTPQIYDQLATTYRKAGQEEDARRVAIAKQWHRRSVMNPVGKALNWLLYVTVGYGYRTWIAAVWLAGLTALGGWIFSQAYPMHMIAIKTHPPTFQPGAFALDLLLPVVNLGQQSAWQPEGYAMYWSWALIGAGWILTTVVVAGLSGIFNRN